MKDIALVALAVVSGCVTVLADADNGRPQTEEVAADKAVNLCSTCHGPRGVSTSPEFPTLAAQREAYLVAQMKAFRDRSRGDKEAHQYMWGIAAQLDDDTIEGLARYYSMQAPPPARPVNEALAAEGSELFHRGIRDRGIPACATCHGQNAEGDGEKPRLAGQHAKYVDKQLGYIQAEQRDSLAMRETIKNLTNVEREEVAAYVQSLGPETRVGSTR